MKIDLNCDLGEGEHPAHTRALMQWITSANIACGGHAGDEGSMRHCVRLAKEHGVNVGAHPGPIDRDKRGRGDFSLQEGELESVIAPQIDALKSIAESEKAHLHHIKLHGALYHAVESNEALAMELVGLTRSRWPGTRLVALAGGRVVRASRQYGAPVWEEAFADRAYRKDHRLVPRSEPGAIMDDPSTITDRLRKLIESGTLSAQCGTVLKIRCDTICVHSDSPNAIEIVRALGVMLR